MKITRPISICAPLLALTLSGCSTLPGDYARSHTPGTGCFIVGWGDQPNNTANRTSGVSFQGAGNPEHGALSYSHLMLKLLATGTQFKDEDGQGTMFVRYVPPGTYELFDPYVSVVSYPMVETFKPKTRVSIPFKVKANECTYVGRFLMNPFKLEFRWVSRKDNDVKLVAAQLPPNFVLGDVVTPKSQTSPFIVAE